MALDLNPNKPPKISDLLDAWREDNTVVAKLPCSIAMLRKLIRMQGYTGEDTTNWAIDNTILDNRADESSVRGFAVLQNNELVEVVWRREFPDKIGVKVVVQNVESPTTSELVRREVGVAIDSLSDKSD